MPGDTPQEAVTAFLNPLKSAVCVLDGPGAITVTRRGGWVKGETYSWVLNAGHGMKLGNVGTFHASMRFRVIDTDPTTNDFGKHLRVTTLGYNYKLEQSGSDMWRIHWHPDGLSDVREPHLHFPPDSSVHRPCDRMTLENAIRWCIEDGAPLTCTRSVHRPQHDLTAHGDYDPNLICPALGEQVTALVVRAPRPATRTTHRDLSFRVIDLTQRQVPRTRCR